MTAGLGACSRGPSIVWYCCSSLIVTVALGGACGETFPFRYAILDRNPVCESTDLIRLPDSPPSFDAFIIFIFIIISVVIVLARGNDSVNRLLPPDGDEPTPASQCAALVCADDCTALCLAAFGYTTS